MSLIRDQSQPLCAVINNNASNQSTGLRIHLQRRTPSDTSSITDNRENKPPSNLMSSLSSTIGYGPIEAAPPPPKPRQKNAPLLPCTTSPMYNTTVSTRKLKSPGGFVQTLVATSSGNQIQYQSWILQSQNYAICVQPNAWKLVITSATHLEVRRS